MEDEKKTLYTEEGYKKLVDELEFLKTTKVPEIKKALEEARAFGDLSENSEYDEAKNEQTKTFTRIGELEALILHAEVIDESAIQADIVSIGSVVTVHNGKTNKEVEYSIVGSNEADPFLGRISDQSPIGSALLGSKAGDEVVAHAINGDIPFKIISVTRAKSNF